jgi:hypothetical protein
VRGDLLALGSVGVLAAAGMARRGARSKKMTLADLTFDPRSAIVYFDLVIEDYNIEDDAGNPESELHAYAVQVREDMHGGHDLESEIYREVRELLGFSIGNEGHGSDDALICKTYPKTAEEAFHCMKVLPDAGGQISTPYGAVEDVRFYPQGAGGPYLTWEGASEQISDENVNVEDWFEIHMPRQLLGGILTGDRYVSKKQLSRRSS